jgi:hypothetical protein
MRISLACGLLGLAAAGASGSVLDLTTAQSSGIINGARFETQDFRSAGTGVLQPFVRIQANGNEQGYNTSGRPTAFDENSSLNFTHNLQLFQLPVVTIGNDQFYEFSLDINQISSGMNSLLSLDRVQLFTTSTASLTTANLGAAATLRYDLDANEDNWIRMDYNLASGSGQGDVRMFIPISALGNALGSDYVYMYSQFGLHHESNDGFEEWAVRTAVPAPGALAPLLLGATVLTRRRRR